MDIQFRNVSYVYQKGSPLAHTALSNIDLEIESGTINAIIGKTGSGKSTLLRHFNALILPSDGYVRMGNIVIGPKTGNTSLKQLRKQVGMAFQFPEAQLFAQTVKEDIIFGPKNYGMNEGQALAKASEVLNLVGLDDSYLDRSPFELSGGEQRRVAIASVLATDPSVLVLDEPGAGLDPKGNKDIMDLIYRLNKEKGVTIILSIHNMEDIAMLADNIIVLEEGRNVLAASPEEVFQREDILERNSLDLPKTIKFAKEMHEKYGWHFDKLPLNMDELAAGIKNNLNGKEQGHV